MTANLGIETRAYCRSCRGYRASTIEGEASSTKAVGAFEEEHHHWSLMRCRGCGDVSALKKYWNTFDLDEDGAPKITTTYYPAKPVREAPSWPDDWPDYLPVELAWIDTQLVEIYECLNTRAFNLVSMGCRSIIDAIVTHEANVGGSFPDKVGDLVARTVLTTTERDYLNTAFDVASATAHRGHRLNRLEAIQLLEMTESLVHRVYVVRAQQAAHGVSAGRLAERTPLRPPEKPRPKK